MDERKKKIGVLGAGMMGSEIALCCAKAGYEVLMKEKEMELAITGKKHLKQLLEKAVAKGKFEDRNIGEVLSRIEPTDSYQALETADFVVEAVYEDLKIKRQVLGELDKICKKECIFTSNTSSIPITLLASSVEPDRKKRFLGTHFFSPASAMKLVEVIPGLETNESAIMVTIEWCERIGKVPIRVKDVPGFAVNRLLHAMWIEATRLLAENVATVEDLDTACKLGLGHPIGPFELMDITNNRLNLEVQEILWRAYGDRFKPNVLLAQKVNANHLGRKTGRGWYRYK
jgi:3-hydroxybutyryl-CoA dehydrogenase